MKNGKLVANGVSKWFKQGGNQLVILNEVSVTFEQGATYGIKGVSGTGKSTLLHIMAGLDSPSKGTVSLYGVPFAEMSDSQLMRVRNEQLGLVFQQPYLIKELSVIENIMMPQLVGGISYEQAHVHAAGLLQRVGLQEKSEALPASLSGGQQQRIAIMRALSNKPLFLLADEPTGNLDEKTGVDIIDFLLECQSEWGMGLIISSHDAYVAQKMDTVYTLHDGRLSA
jgi:lipoprotein-releasing system ATP-binding protein